MNFYRMKGARDLFFNLFSVVKYYMNELRNQDYLRSLLVINITTENLNLV